jgi:hypothetical protein
MILLLLLITVAMPMGWLVAEFKARPFIRRTMGILTILWSFGVAAMVGSLRDFNANVYFTGASKVC